MSLRISTWMVSAVSAAAILGRAPAVRAQEAPVFAGTWALNIDKTEPAKDRVIEEPETTGAGRTMRTGLGARGGGGSTGGGIPRSSSGGSAGRGNVGLIFGGMMVASKTLKVTQADSVVTIENEDGPLFVNLRADNKGLEETLANQTVLKTRVQWKKKSELVVERSHDTDGAARLIFRIDPKNPKLMVVDFHYEHKRQRRTIDQRRIYEAGV